MNEGKSKRFPFPLSLSVHLFFQNHAHIFILSMMLRELHFTIDSSRGHAITIFENDDFTSMYIPSVTHLGGGEGGGHFGVLHVSLETMEE